MHPAVPGSKGKVGVMKRRNLTTLTPLRPPPTAIAAAATAPWPDTTSTGLGLHSAAEWVEVGIINDAPALGESASATATSAAPDVTRQPEVPAGTPTPVASSGSVPIAATTSSSSSSSDGGAATRPFSALSSPPPHHDGLDDDAHTHPQLSSWPPPEGIPTQAEHWDTGNRFPRDYSGDITRIKPTHVTRWTDQDDALADTQSMFTCIQFLKPNKKRPKGEYLLRIHLGGGRTPIIESSTSRVRIEAMFGAVARVERLDVKAFLRPGYTPLKADALVARLAAAGITSIPHFFAFTDMVRGTFVPVGISPPLKVYSRDVSASGSAARASATKSSAAKAKAKGEGKGATGGGSRQSSRPTGEGKGGRSRPSRYSPDSDSEETEASESSSGSDGESGGGCSGESEGELSVGSATASVDEEGYMPAHARSSERKVAADKILARMGIHPVSTLLLHGLFNMPALRAIALAYRVPGLKAKATKDTYVRAVFAHLTHLRHPCTRPIPPHIAAAMQAAAASGDITDVASSVTLTSAIGIALGLSHWATTSEEGGSSDSASASGGGSVVAVGAPRHLLWSDIFGSGPVPLYPLDPMASLLLPGTAGANMQGVYFADNCASTALTTASGGDCASAGGSATMSGLDCLAGGTAECGATAAGAVEDEDVGEGDVEDGDTAFCKSVPPEWKGVYTSAEEALTHYSLHDVAGQLNGYTGRFHPHILHFYHDLDDDPDFLAFIDEFALSLAQETRASIARNELFTIPRVTASGLQEGIMLRVFPLHSTRPLRSQYLSDEVLAAFAPKVGDLVWAATSAAFPDWPATVVDEGLLEANGFIPAMLHDYRELVKEQGGLGKVVIFCYGIEPNLVIANQSELEPYCHTHPDDLPAHLSEHLSAALSLGVEHANFILQRSRMRVAPPLPFEVGDSAFACWGDGACAIGLVTDITHNEHGCAVIHMCREAAPPPADPFHWPALAEAGLEVDVSPTATGVCEAGSGSSSAGVSGTLPSHLHDDASADKSLLYAGTDLHGRAFDRPDFVSSRYEGGESDDEGDDGDTSIFASLPHPELAAAFTALGSGSTRGSPMHGTSFSQLRADLGTSHEAGVGAPPTSFLSHSVYAPVIAGMSARASVGTSRPYGSLTSNTATATRTGTAQALASPTHRGSRSLVSTGKGTAPPLSPPPVLMEEGDFIRGVVAKITPSPLPAAFAVIAARAPPRSRESPKYSPAVEALIGGSLAERAARMIL